MKRWIALAALSGILTACALLNGNVPTVNFKDGTTPSPTVKSSTPTKDDGVALYHGERGADDRAIRYFKIGSCIAMEISTAGESHRLTSQAPADCTEPRFSPDGGRIAFMDESSHTKLSLMNADGTGIQLVTLAESLGGHMLPIWEYRWSPDASLFAVIHAGTSVDDNDQTIVWDKAGNVSTVPADGSGRWRSISFDPIEPAYQQVFSWSPDGKWILSMPDAATGPAADPYTRPVIDMNSGLSGMFIDPDNFSRIPGRTMHFDWSPDSAAIAFVYPERPVAVPFDPIKGMLYQSYLVIQNIEKKNGSADIAYLRLEGTGSGWYGNYSWSPTFGARWSPDGKSLLLFNVRTNELVLFGRDGVPIRTVATVAQEPIAMQWSPDGKWILLVMTNPKPNGSNLLEAIRADGGEVRILATGVSPYSLVWK